MLRQRENRRTSVFGVCFLLVPHICLTQGEKLACEFTTQLSMKVRISCILSTWFLNQEFQTKPEFKNTVQLVSLVLGAP